MEKRHLFEIISRTIAFTTLSVACLWVVGSQIQISKITDDSDSEFKVAPTFTQKYTQVSTYVVVKYVQPLNDDWVSFPIISHRPQPLKLNFLSSLKWMWNCIFPPLPSYVSSPSSPVLPHSTVLRFVQLCLIRYFILNAFCLSIS